MAEGGSYVHDSGLLLFLLCLLDCKSFTIFWCRPHTPHGRWLLSHAIPIMREILHYTQDGKRNYKSTKDCGPTLRQPVYCIYGLNVFQASFSVPKTPLAIILCSTVVFLTLSYGEKKKSDVDTHIQAHTKRGERTKNCAPCPGVLWLSPWYIEV